tara:strand:- start:3474 stop:3719 length:246 start_codon:yes stop_codon:yes gene_type:complete
MINAGSSHPPGGHSSTHSSALFDQNHGVSVQGEPMGASRSGHSSSKYGDFHDQIGERNLREIEIFVDVDKFNDLKIVNFIG